MADTDLFTREVIRECLVAMGDEMFVILKRTAHSPLIFETLDYAVGATDREGELICTGSGVTGFLGTLDAAVKAVLAKFGSRQEIHPGDIFITNDPFGGGGSHLSDISLILPVFAEGELIAFVVNKAHWSEVGGKDRGSVSSDSTEIFQEGLQFPNVKLCERGRMSEALLDMLRANVRLPDMTLGDLWAGIAALRAGESRILGLIEKYGRPEVVDTMAALLDYGEHMARLELDKLPQGTFEARDWIDDDGLGNGPFEIRCRVTIGDGRFIADFTGSHPQASSSRCACPTAAGRCPSPAIRASRSRAVRRAMRCARRSGGSRAHWWRTRTSPPGRRKREADAMFKRYRTPASQSTEPNGAGSPPTPRVQPDKKPLAATPPMPSGAMPTPTSPQSQSPLRSPPGARSLAAPQSPDVAPRPAGVARAPGHGDEGAEARRRKRLLDLRIVVHQRLLEGLNLSAIEDAPESELRQEIAAITRETLADLGVVVNALEFDALIGALIDEVTGLGPLEPLLKDPSITDILVNTHEQCFVERYGRLELTEVQFKDERHLMRVIDKIVSAVGRRVDESQPWVDARLQDGSRVNALVPPCAVDGPLLSIRKFSKVPFGIDTLLKFDAFSEGMADFLRAVVSTRLNVLVSGGTGSGKTTTLNALSSFISNRERIVTIEDTAELQLQQVHVGRMESRPPNIEGKGEVNQRDLLRNALRMRPDRIIVGEVRGGEVLDMLQAMNTGHEGSMTTIHANNPRDATARIENMVSMSGVDMPMKAVRAQIASAINVIVQVSRLSDGTRRMISIHEITGMEGDVIAMQEIFRFDRRTVGENGEVIGDYVATGIRSAFADRFDQWGVRLPRDLFVPGRTAG